MNAIRTTCPYCGTGCGVAASAEGKRRAAIAGDPAHPANTGRLCSKGTYLGETLGLEGRLLRPMIGPRSVDWSTALDVVARRFAETIDTRGRDSVAFYVSGQLLTEDYYAFNKLMKGFIGSANIDTNSRLCMASAVAAHVRTFGEDVVPACYDDIDVADLVVVVGSNTAWCHPVLWQRLEDARTRRGTKVIVIDPRRTETAEQADLHIPLKAGTDVALFNGLLAYVAATGATDVDFLAQHVAVPADFWQGLGSARIGDIAAACDVPEATLRAFFTLFTETPRTVTLFSMGVNQSTQGTDKANAIINVHLATGRIGRPGAAPFSLTGQPNAMGGREVGGLANTLAAHMDFAPENVARAQRFWRSDRVATQPGLKAVDMFRAVADGRIKAIWIAGTNPAASMPNAGAVRTALAHCPFVVVSDVMAETDTAKFAHVRLPALGWGEKDGTVTNSERCISRQRAFLPWPGDARPDWWMVTQVARRLGFGQAFGWHSAAAIFREHAAFTAFENDGARKLNLVQWAALSDAGYDGLAPAPWGGARPFTDNRFSTPDGRARLVSVQPEKATDAVLVLNTGRYRDQWHTMTRTGLSPTLSRHRREPVAEIHPDDADAASLKTGDLVRIATAKGVSAFRVAVTPAQRRGEVFVPIHWTDCQARGGRAGLLSSDAVDPVSGQPGLKLAPASIAKIGIDWHGFVLARKTIAPPDSLWAVSVPVTGGTLWELAGCGDLPSWDAVIPRGERVEAHDYARGYRRLAVLSEGKLEFAMYLTKGGTLPPRDWLMQQLGAHVSAAAVLAGRPAGSDSACDPAVCLCHNVGARAITAAIARDGLADVAAIGRATGAGTNCGSCRPALARLLASTRVVHAAE